MSLYLSEQELSGRRKKTYAKIVCRDLVVLGNPINEALDALVPVLAFLFALTQPTAYSCGYSLGSTLAPNWMDWPMLYYDNLALAAPDRIFFLHIIYFDSDVSLSMILDKTEWVSEMMPKHLSHPHWI